MQLVDRTAALEALDVSYLHLTVPDRMTIMGKAAGLDALATSPSPAQAMLSRAGGAPAAWVDAMRYFTGQRDAHTLYWKSDERWSPWAAFMGVQLVCGRLGVAANGWLLGYPHHEMPVIGNLAALSGAGDTTPESIRQYRFERHSTPFYEHASGRRGYRNASLQAVPKRVLLYGDEHCGADRSLFAGMLAETFAEVHVMTGPLDDLALVHRLRPDVVITECAERRLALMPDEAWTLEPWADVMPCLSADSTSSRFFGRRRARAVHGARPAQIERTLLLGAETYHLDPPITAQAACVNDLNDAAMRTRPVTLVDVTDAEVYFDGPRHLITSASGESAARFGVLPDEEASLPSSRRRRLRGTTLVFATSAGAHCYYHWMLELLPKLGLLERAGIRADEIDHVLVREISGPWQLETLARCGIPADRIVECAKKSWFRCERALHIDLNAGINLKMNRFVPQWMKHLYPLDAVSQPRLKLYIRRPEGVRRGIANELALQPLLDRHGFTSVAMEGLSVAEQAALLARADVVMSPHGGALTNMVFCRAGTRVIELLSRHVYPYYYGLAASCGHVYHAVLENPGEDYPRLVSHDIAQRFAAPQFQHETHSSSFDVPVEPLARLLRWMDTSATERAHRPPVDDRPEDDENLDSAVRHAA